MSSKILTALFLAGWASALYAGPVYSCGGGSACDGNLYAVWVSQSSSSFYVLNVGIQVTTGYTGSTIDSINGLSITPDNPKPFTSAGLSSAPPTGSWSFQAGGLNATAMGTGSHLFTFPLMGGAATPNLLVWQFTIMGPPPSLGDTAHINYTYVDLGGSHVGVLGSFDIPIQCIGGISCASGPSGLVTGNSSTVPEPVSLSLVGGGLLALGLLRKRLPRR